MDFPCSTRERENCINAFGAREFFPHLTLGCCCCVDAHLQGNDDAKFIGSHRARMSGEREKTGKKCKYMQFFFLPVSILPCFFARTDDEASEGGR